MNPAAQSLQDAVRSLLGPGVAVSCCEIGAATAPLYPEEEAAITRAVASRRAEFAAGRQAARDALRALGQAPAPIPMGADRAPIWPAGLTGTITHANGLALAAMGKTHTLRALGLDLEQDAPLEADLWPSILRDEERTWLAQYPEKTRAHWAMRIFSAKEATYKAQYAITGTFLDFHDISVAYMNDTSRFTATFQTSAGPFAKGSRLSGSQLIKAAMILSALRIQP